MREAVGRQARSQRVWIDGPLLQRKYREALAQFGELVYQMATAGELPDVAEHPELARHIEDLQIIDERLVEAEDRVREATAAARDTAERLAARAGLPTGMLGRPRSRRARTEPPAEVGVWRPPVDVADPDDPLDDDGTVAAVTGKAAAAPAPRQPPPRRGPRRAGPRGGISFDDEDDDADLADYMHPDDVPGDGQEK